MDDTAAAAASPSGSAGGDPNQNERESSAGSSFVMSFVENDSPWAAGFAAAAGRGQEQEQEQEQEQAQQEGAGEGGEGKAAEEEEEEPRKLTPEEAALAEAEALRASDPSIAAAVAAAESVSSSSTYSNAAEALGAAAQGQGQGRASGSIGDDYRAMEEQKAKGKERLQALVASKEHARRTFPCIRRDYTDHYLKIMVAGESGHGKTSFINNLFLSYTNGRDVKPHDGARTRVEDFLADPDALCTRFSVENEATQERMHYTIQDTPGYGDDTDITKSIDMVLSHVEACNARYLERETDAARMEPMAAQEDPRVDVCLYFIAAHRLKAIDLKFMTAIAARAALIPVIAKADSMTAEETVAFRREIMAECERHCIPLFEFGEAAKKNVGIPADLIVPPFAVVASNKFDAVRGAGSHWPVRDYLWGTCEAFSTQHSDCTYLKRLLLEEGFHDLRKATERRYLEYRRDHLAKAEAAQRAAEARKAQRTRRWILIGLATLALVAGLGTLLATPPPSARGEAEDEEQLAWGRRQSPLAFLFGRGGGAEGDEQLHALAARLQGKEAELQAAQQTIDLLVSSVRSLEASMSRLVGGGSGAGATGSQQQQLGGGDVVAGGGDAGGIVSPPLFVRVEEDVSAKSLSEIDRLLHRLGFGGVLAAELEAAAATANDEATTTNHPTQAGGGTATASTTTTTTAAAAAAAVPPAEVMVAAAGVREQGEATAPRNASDQLEVPSPPPSTKPAGATASADAGWDRRQQQQQHQHQRRSSSPSSSSHKQQRKRRRCLLGEVGAWLTDVARFHEEKFVEGWEHAMRWFLD